MNEPADIQSSKIIQNILDFYSLQPGIKGEVLERIETFLVVVYGHYVEVQEDLSDLMEDDLINPLDEMLDVLNGYLNALGEEYEKIFEAKENIFQPIAVFAGPVVEYLPFVEALRAWNCRSRDLFGVNELLDELEGEVLGNEIVTDRLKIFTLSLIQQIQLKIVTHLEDLI